MKFSPTAPLAVLVASMVLLGWAAAASTPSAPAAHPTPAARQTGPYDGHELARQARVTISAARVIALRAHPGRVTDQELEREQGGSGLRYSFDIVDHGRTYEVGVDARTGLVLENAAEGANPD